MNTSIFHSLEGENICFKPLNTDDVLVVHSFASDVHVSRFIGWKLMQTLNQTYEYIEEMIKRESAGTHLYGSIVLKSTKEIIGTAMIFNFDREAKHAEIGYVFHRNYWGKGFGTETVSLMNRYAFEALGQYKLHARVVDANIGSIRVLEKSGYELEGCLREYHFIEGVYYDSLLFGKFQSSYED